MSDHRTDRTTNRTVYGLNDEGLTGHRSRARPAGILGVGARPVMPEATSWRALDGQTRDIRAPRPSGALRASKVSPYDIGHGHRSPPGSRAISDVASCDPRPVIRPITSRIRSLRRSLDIEPASHELRKSTRRCCHEGRCPQWILGKRPNSSTSPLRTSLIQSRT